ncbi:MAG: DegT/DnrJ/EryC1/StrS family aminotransferase [Burkholderiales bacterium]|nr:DegT/DnrJ/EryC1/StrS family aminotransferase [Burkholderiales bacterium]
MSEEILPLSDPDISRHEMEMVEAALCSPRLGQGRLTEAFEAEFSTFVGRRYGVAVSSSTLALMLVLCAWKTEAGAEIVCSPHSWHQIARGISLAGAVPVFADIDYWAGGIDPAKALEKIGENTRAILACNANGHPAAWNELRELASGKGIHLIEDCSESIGSRYCGSQVGTFGDCSIFDFSQQSALCCGEGAMILTDDLDFARTLRHLRDRQIRDRHSISITSFLPFNARISELTAALGLAQLSRLEEILEKRRQVAFWYESEIKSFEGIKPPYLAPEADRVNWFLYAVHLGTRFSLSSCRAIVEDLHTAGVEAEFYSQPLHLERYYIERGWRKGNCFVAEKVADRAIALPFHTHLQQDEIQFIVKTAKDASVNVGAGAAIYL